MIRSGKMKPQAIDDVDEDITPTQTVQIWGQNSMGWIRRVFIAECTGTGLL